MLIVDVEQSLTYESKENKIKMYNNNNYYGSTSQQQLRNEIEQLKTQVANANTKCQELEDKCEKLQSELTNFTKYESVRKVKQIEDHLGALDQNLKSVIEDMTIWSKKSNQQEFSANIEQQMGQYRQRKLELSQAGIVFMSEPDFAAIIEDYHKICRINNTKIKHIFKPLYEATKKIQHKTNLFTLKIGNSLENIDRFSQEENNKLKKLDYKSVQDSINVEANLYADILETIAERMVVFDSIKTTVEGRNAKTKTSAMRKSYQHLIENFDGSLDSCENSIIIYKIPESEVGEDDLTKVKSFLNHANLKTNLEITVKRLEGLGRPLKVTFSDTQIIQQLLQLSNEKTFFRGSYIMMKKCNQ